MYGVFFFAPSVSFPHARALVRGERKLIIEPAGEKGRARAYKNVPTRRGSPGGEESEIRI